MASNYWIKLYHEILDDPKMGRLPDRLWRRTIELFLLAGDMGQPDGQLPSVTDMAWRLRITDEELEEDLQQLERIGLISQCASAYCVKNFAKRQAPLSSTERTRLQRKRDRQQGVEWIPELVSQVPDDAGIYAIRCKATNRMYIGASTNMKRRVSDHIREITQTNNHPISEDFREYGEESLEVLIIENVQDPVRLKEREGHWLGQYAPQLLYNRESRSKRHRDWVGTEEGRHRDDHGTNRPIDIDSESDLEAEENPETRAPEPAKVTSRPDSPPPLPRTVKQAYRHPDLSLVHRVCSIMPGQSDYAPVIDAVRLLRQTYPDEDELSKHLGKHWVAWSSRKSSDGQEYSRTNFAWLTEWAVNDYIPPASRNGKHAAPEGPRRNLTLERLQAEQ